MKELNKHSKRLTQDESQPASQAMLYAVGLSDEDMQKAQIGIASTGYDGNPCNMHLNNLAAEVKIECNIAGLVGLGFNTIGVSDGISMGTSGMNYSLASRDIIADSIETVMNAQSYDALVSVVGSGLMGSLSGSAVANAMMTGSFTIPMMKDDGFEKHTALCSHHCY